MSSNPKTILKNSFLIFIIGVLTFSPLTTHASNELYDVRDFRFKVESVGEVAPDNGNSVIDVVRGTDPGVEMLFRLTLERPPLFGNDDAIGVGDRLNISQDVIFGGAKEREGQFEISPEIRGFYLWIVPKGKIDSRCEAGVAGVGSYLDCSDANNVGRQANIDQVVPNSPVTQEVSIDSSTVSDAIVKGNPEPVPEGGQQIEMWAVIGIDLGGADPIFDGSSSKRFYLRVFDSQDDLDKATTRVINTPPGVSTNAEGLSAFDWLGGSLLTVVNLIVGALAALVRFVVWIISTVIVIPLLETTLSMDANEIAGGPVVAGWTFVRDVVNMFFILFLIVIGFATMLRLESYNHRKLLVNLILMALLVNFSLVIGRVVIEITDIAQFTFLPEKVNITDASNPDGISGVKFLYKQLSTVHIGSILDGFRGGTTDTSGALAVTFSILFQLALELGVMLTFAALAIFMLIRTVAIWILLVISPLAYALFVLPATASLAKKWWSNYIKYALFAPIIAFFLRLTLVFYQEGLGITTVWKFSRPADGSPPGDLVEYVNDLGGQVGGITFGDSLSLGLVYIMILALMWAGLIVAKNMGIYGAQGIVGMAERGMKLPFAGGAKLGRYMSGAVDQWLAKGIERKGPGAYNALRRAGSYLSPTALKKGFEARREKKEFEAFTEAAGQRADLLNKLIRWPWPKGGGEKTDFQLRAQQTRVNEELGNIPTKNREELALLYEQAIKENNPYKAMAYANRMAQNYDLNELLSYRGYGTDHQGLIEMVETDLVPLLGKQAAYRAGYDLSRMAEDVNHWNYARAFTGIYDPTSGKIEYEPNMGYEVEGDVFSGITENKAGKEVLVEISKLARRLAVGGGNRLAWGFVEVDDPEKGRIEKEWNDYGRERWATEIPDREFYNQFNKNAESNIMLKHSKDALGLNKEAWLMSAHKLSELTDTQLLQWRDRVAEPEQGWERTQQDGQVFSMETVHKYLQEGVLSVEEVQKKIQGKTDLKDNFEKWYQREYGTGVDWSQYPTSGGGGTPTAPRGGGGGGSSPGGGGAPAGGGRQRSYERTTREIIRETEGGGEISSDQMERISNELRNLQTGGASADEIKQAVSEALDSQERGDQVIEKVVERTASDMVGGVDRDVFGIARGVDPAVIRRAVRDGIREGLKDFKVGSTDLTQSVVAKIQQAAPGIDEGRAREIAEEVNRKRE